LVRRYQEHALRLACFVIGDASEAEDAVQEAFVKGFCAMDRFRRGASFKPWLLRIVANEAKNRRRSARRRDDLWIRLAGAVNHEASEPSPEVGILAEERREALAAALCRLDEDDRMVICYRYFLDLSEKEMAEAMGCARGTVKSRLCRAMGRLRIVLVETVEIGRPNRGNERA